MNKIKDFLGFKYASLGFLSTKFNKDLLNYPSERRTAGY